MADWMENMLIVRGGRGALEKWNRVLLKGDEKVGKLSFEKLMPLPEDESDWYRWCMENWGAKWDTAPYGEAEKIERGYLYAFLTPWVAPIPLIEKLTEIHKGLDFEPYISIHIQKEVMSSIVEDACLSSTWNWTVQTNLNF
ncbi:hypothetical protein [Planococcus salinus]|uniref:YubB ferredoxin-like domain-containing protein n=1 Tax=Planococcus salinus TaxID=1848460 RepID=A0A3M8P8T0_9BACL|nr:hypothetical protein [Planococcus salinus]RNF39604.1 hypothetical protein EEX84_09025 [Planococcus salinus]